MAPKIIDITHAEPAPAPAASPAPSSPLQPPTVGPGGDLAKVQRAVCMM